MLNIITIKVIILHNHSGFITRYRYIINVMAVCSIARCSINDCCKFPPILSASPKIDRRQEMGWLAGSQRLFESIRQADQEVPDMLQRRMRCLPADQKYFRPGR